MTAAIRWGAVIGAADEIDGVAAAGADYLAVEMPYLVDCDDEEFNLKKNLLSRSGLAPEVCLTVLPSGVAVTTAGFNRYDWTDYLRLALQRLSQVGCRLLLWRDGAARALPIEGDQSAMKAQVLQFVHQLCRLCTQHDITLLVEPLPAAETNYLNTMQGAQEFFAQVRQGNLQAAVTLPMADGIDGDMPLADMAASARHIYFAEGAASEQLSAWCAAGYNGHITLAGGVDAARLQQYRALVK